MAKEHELIERIERVGEITDELESGEPSREEGERLLEEGRQKLDEVRDILDRGDGQIIELPE